jgi:Mrp family chromosome partitioning ATPase
VDVAIAAGDAAWEEAAIREIEASAVLRLARRCVDIADLLALAQTDRAQAAIVSTDLPGLDLDAVHRLQRAGMRVAAIGSDVTRCADLGITSMVRLGELDEISDDLPTDTTASHRRHAPIVAVWGPAGSPGRSTVALGIAASAAGRGVDSVLIDVDTYGGSQGQLLGVLDDVSGLMAACRAANNGRPGEVVDHLLEIDPRLRLLTGLPRADMWPQVRTGALDAVLTQLRGSAELIVADCAFSIEPGTSAGPARNQTTLQVLEQADAVVVVGRPDPVGLARLVRGLHDLSALLPGAAPVVAINMMRPSLGWNERDVRATVSRLTGIEPTVHLPLDQSSVDLAAVSGRSPREALTSHVLSSVVSPFAVAATGS